MWRRVARGLRPLWRRGRMEHEMEAELRFHLEREAEENVRRGMSPEAARAAARRSFGGVDQVKEECRDARGGGLVETLGQDLRFGLRVLRHNPGFALLATLTLALGIGANTAIFSVIYGVLVRPLPYHEGERLVVLKQRTPLAGVEELPFSVKEIEDYRGRNRTLEGVVEYHTMTFLLLGRAEPERVRVGVVSANFFDLLGVPAELGRTFRAGEDGHGAEPVLILSHRYWRESHGGDPGIVGRTFRMNDRAHTVVGVLPAIPQYPQENDVYMPVSACPTRSAAGFIGDRKARMMTVFGRLKPGVPVTQAQADLATIAGALRQEYPDAYPARHGYGATAAPLREELTRQARPTFLILLGTAGLVLLIACANVANLMLARLMRREREMALRAALGASRGRLIRQLLTESTLLALAGGGLGLLIAAGGLDLLVAFAARFTTRAGEIRIDALILLFTLVISVFTGLGFGLMPAFSFERDLLAALKEGGSRATAGAGRRRLRDALIVAQVAVSFMLLTGAGLMIRSLLKLQQVDPGFNPEKVLTIGLNPNWSKYRTREQYRDFYRRLLERVERQPEVLSAAVGSTYPLNPEGISFGPWNRNYVIEGRPLADSEPAPQADFRSVSPGYFGTIRLPLIRGRAFTEQDHEDAPEVALINQALARHRWGEEDPIGKRVSFNRGETWITVVGVVGDVKQYGLNREVTDEFYRPMAQFPSGNNLLARTTADPSSLARTVRRLVHEVDPETAVTDVHTLEEARRDSLASPRLMTLLLGLFAGLALLITAAGIAGVIALTVSQRTHEIGIRMALGATRASVLGLVMRQGLALAVAGLGLGLLGALALARLMAHLLFDVEPTDPLTLLAVTALLLVVATIACLVPAQRVTGIDPLRALRAE